MLATLSARRSDALPVPTDLGFLLHKHPDRHQSTEVYGGTAHVFYPEVCDEVCTVALLLEVDPEALARGRARPRGDHAAGHQVDERPYVASSLLSVAMGKVFRSALNRSCTGHEELVDTPLELRVDLPTVPGDPELAARLFTPMGWSVETRPIPLDTTRPDWGPAAVFSLTLQGSATLADALNHLYVLLPVLDDAKHYWVDETEIDKLLRAGSSWLPGHPERELIAHRSLAGQRGLRREALDRLAELDDRPSTDVEERETAPRPLVRLRHEAVLDEVRRLAPTSVVDLGCGQGALIASLLELRGVEHVTGTDVSDRALAAAADRLHVETMTERQAARLDLLLSSLLYEDARLEGADVAVLMEVVEHIDPERLPTVERTVFAAMRPRHVVLTTPNGEYNVRYPGLADGGMRHDDHRFEWTRAEFADWTDAVAGRHGYRVRREPVGPVDPEVGPPTQMAVFSLDEAPAAAVTPSTGEAPA